MIFMLLGVGSIFLSSRFGPRIVDLYRLDGAAYATCKKLLDHPLVKSKDVRFFVYFGNDLFPKKFNEINAVSFIAVLVNGEPEYEHIIIFPPAVIKSGCLEVAVAHELGHINLKTTNELAVDEFTVNILGQGNKKLVRDCLIKAGGTLDSARITVLSE
ncbi:MAG: hypothetical protein HYT65_02030 [Candidatus Yanofskybacteria bacterium]|nr:hypothetical protein [Candidatus Yanofskybacteria bacterium]